MNYNDFTNLISDAGLTLGEFAGLVRMNRISLCNYAKGDRVPSHLRIIAALLAEMRKSGNDFRPVFDRLELQPKRPRGAGIGKFGGDKQGRLF